MQVSRHTGPCYCFLIFGLSQSLPVSGLIKLNPVNYTTERNGPSVQPKAECFSFLWMYCVLSFCCNCLVTKLCLTFLWPHGLQPTRLLCPQDFPGKNTGVGCHCSSSKSSQPRDQTHVFGLAGRFFTTEPPGKPCSLFVCEKYVLGSQLYLTLWNPMNYRLSGSSGHGILWARILEWVTIPFSGGSSQSRDRTQVSCIMGGLLTIWATREACSLFYMDLMEHYTWYFLWNPTHHFFLYLLSYFRSHFKCHFLSEGSMILLRVLSYKHYSLS